MQRTHKTHAWLPQEEHERQPKPESFSPSYAESFKDQQVVDAYRYRPPYPDEVFRILSALMTEEPRTVLDVRTGSGDLARRLVEFAQRVDAVDPSVHMIARGVFQRRSSPRRNSALFCPFLIHTLLAERDPSLR
jgi:predicted TPR repeat methyltransferase